MKYALINKETKRVENIVEWDGDPNVWQPPEGYEVITTDDKPTIDWVWNPELNDYEQVETVGNVQIGEVWDGVKFVEVDKPEPPERNNDTETDSV